MQEIQISMQEIQISMREIQISMREIQGKSKKRSKTSLDNYFGRSHDHQTPRICGCTKLEYDRIR